MLYLQPPCKFQNLQHDTQPSSLGVPNVNKSEGQKSEGSEVISPIGERLLALYLYKQEPVFKKGVNCGVS